MIDDIANSTDILCWIILKSTHKRYTKSEMKDVRISCYTYLLACKKIQEWNTDVLHMLNKDRYRPNIDKEKAHQYAEDVINHHLSYNLP